MPRHRIEDPDLDKLRARLLQHGRVFELPRYALVDEQCGYEFLIDLHKIYSISYITFRRDDKRCIVWVDDEDVEVEETEFDEEETARIRALAQENREDLIMWFLTIRNDWKRDRLERNCLVD